MTQTTMAELGRSAYRAYGQVTDFKNFQGDPMPEWDDLGQHIQEAWMESAYSSYMQGWRHAREQPDA